MPLYSLLAGLSGLLMQDASTPNSESKTPQKRENTMFSQEPVCDPMSTEDLAQTLLERLNAGSKLSSTTATRLTTAIAAAISYRHSFAVTTAAHDVFHTPELLESILVNNDLMQITTSQRVSRQFQATITGSTKLQEKLWLRLNHSPNTRCQIPKCECRRRGENKPFQLEINPLLSTPTFLARHAIRSFTHELRSEHYVRRLSVDLTFGTIAELRALKPGGWQEMLIVQPVSRERDRWNMSFSFEGGGFTRSVGKGTWFEALTLGEMVEVLLERWEELEGDPWKSVSEWDPDRRGRDRVKKVVGSS